MDSNREPQGMGRNGHQRYAPHPPYPPPNHPLKKTEPFLPSERITREHDALGSALTRPPPPGGPHRHPHPPSPMIASAFSALASLFTTSDEQAMWRVATQDDGHAFAQLVARWETPIRRLGERMTGDPHRAEDIAQETFARIFAHRKDFQPANRFSTWLWRIALNLCHDDLRRRHRRGEIMLDDEFAEPGPDLHVLVTDEPSPDDALATSERHSIVRSALQTLPESYRAVVILKHYEGLKFREIAEVLEIPEGTVKSRLAEALLQLERRLAPALPELPHRRHTPSRRTNRPEAFVL